MLFFRFLFLMILFFSAQPSFGQNDNAAHPPTQQSPVYDDIMEKEKVSDDRFIQEFGNMLLALGGILAVLFIASWFVKRMLNTKIQQVNVTSPIKILERRPLSQKTSVYLLDILGKKIALTESHTGVTVLGEFVESGELTEPAETTSKPSFNQIYNDTKQNG